MLSIEAIVRPERINQVTSALLQAGVQGFYYYNVTGQGRQGGVEVFVGRGGTMITRASVPKTVVRTVVTDDMKDRVVAAIIAAARSPGEGVIGDGKIFISKVEDAVRVRTQDRGDAAL